jgi:NAD(P)-dependent dehydrogenase (short-subunit alcohol dehydrogenase family)
MKLGALLSKIPQGRLGTTDDVFNMIWFIVEGATFVTGHNFFVNGGNYMH